MQQKTKKIKVKHLQGSDYCYSISDKLGVGCFAEVYRCYNRKNLDEELAIKIISLKALREASKDKQQVYDKVIKTEFEVLKRIQDNQNLINYKKIDIRKLREKKIVHRDLKLSNILMHNNLIKIGDFGLALLTEKVDDQQSAVIESKNVGNLETKAPELYKISNYKAENLDFAQCDVFSFGVMIYQLMYSNEKEHPMEIIHPYLHKSKSKVPDIQTFTQTVLKERLQQFGSRKTNRSTELKQFVSKLVDKNPNNRPTWEQIFKDDIVTQSNDLATSKFIQFQKNEKKPIKINLEQIQIDFQSNQQSTVILGNLDIDVQSSENSHIIDEELEIHLKKTHQKDLKIINNESHDEISSSFFDFFQFSQDFKVAKQLLQCDFESTLNYKEILKDSLKYLVENNKIQDYQNKQLEYIFDLQHLEQELENQFMHFEKLEEQQLTEKCQNHIKYLILNFNTLITPFNYTQNAFQNTKVQQQFEFEQNQLKNEGELKKNSFVLQNQSYDHCYLQVQVFYKGLIELDDYLANKSKFQTNHIYIQNFKEIERYFEQLEIIKGEKQCISQENQSQNQNKQEFDFNWDNKLIQEIDQKGGKPIIQF
ncbi:Protein kinase-like domain [Pseudocohnilembus persalinus]|uniref:Protein kinase-like domain n=1 Tax=Pseudocohnilembus persalinus TaxID=266149 RepID=A0A0V0QDX6_PSEPJ|nr:Protein kinase-like domain [Pseudocohnilembus persalinus]|eukprot:KRX00399.1 Protein kinase-like domain [Pseudocohnilembus persalinus]